MAGLLSMMKSRKFWITIIGVILTISQNHLNLSQEQVLTIAGLLAFLAFTIAHEDRGKILKNILSGIDVKSPDEGETDCYLRIDVKKALEKEKK